MCSCFLISEATPEMVKEGYTDTPKDVFEGRAQPFVPLKPKKEPCANCTKWPISHVRQVMMKLKLKTNETKPSEWIIHTPSGRINPKDGLRVLPPVLMKPKKNSSNVTEANA